MAMPRPAQRRRLGSSVEDSDMLPKTIWPGVSRRMPCWMVMILQWVGMMPETWTRLYFSMPAWRMANSSDCGRYLCLPTPLVKKTAEGIGVLHSVIGKNLQSEEGSIVTRERKTASNLAG